MALEIKHPTFVIDYQPYGAKTLGDLRIECESETVNGEKRTYTKLAGTVIKGVEISHGFGRSIARNIAGETYSFYGITQAELDRGSAVRVAA